MMGHREVMANGDEQDAFSRRVRRMLVKRPGKIARIKALFNRRVRRTQKIMERIIDLETDLGETLAKLEDGKPV